MKGTDSKKLKIVENKNICLKKVDQIRTSNFGNFPKNYKKKQRSSLLPDHM